MKHTKATRARVLRMYKAGSTYAEITAATGVAKRLIRPWADVEGLPTRTTARRGYVKAVRVLAVRMYAAGEPMLAIRAACNGASNYAIRCWVDAAGVPRRDGGGKARFDVDALWDAYVLPGATMASAARALGVPYGTAFYHLKPSP